eukprot:gene6804-20954_t
MINAAQLKYKQRNCPSGGYRTDQCTRICVTHEQARPRRRGTPGRAPGGERQRYPLAYRVKPGEQ